MDSDNFFDPTYNYDLKVKNILDHKEPVNFKFIIETLKECSFTFLEVDHKKEFFILDEIYAIFRYDAASYTVNISFRIDEHPHDAAKIGMLLMDIFNSFEVSVEVGEPFYIFDGVYKSGKEAMDLYMSELNSLTEQHAKKIFKEYKILDNLTEENAKYKA